MEFSCGQSTGIGKQREGRSGEERAGSGVVSILGELGRRMMREVTGKKKTTYAEGKYL